MIVIASILAAIVKDPSKKSQLSIVVEFLYMFSTLAGYFLSHGDGEVGDLSATWGRRFRKKKLVSEFNKALTFQLIYSCPIFALNVSNLRGVCCWPPSIDFFGIFFHSILQLPNWAAKT